MPLYTTPDGRYMVAWETPGEGDGNSVIYDNWRAGENNGQPLPIWNRWSYEAERGEARPPAVTPPGAPSVPIPLTPLPATPITTGRLLPVTNASDGRIIPREYSYWSNCWIAEGTYYVFCGTSNGPAFFAVDRQLGAVTRLGNLAHVGGETEGWFWLRDGSLIVLAGSQLLRVNPFRTTPSEVLIDLESLGHPGCDLWQPHSSEDGSTFSATVRRIVSDGKYPNLGTITVRRGTPFYISAEGDLDESHLSGDGRYIIMEERRAEPGNDNRIINLDTRDTRWITDGDGALSHIDCGPDYMVGEADRPDPQCCARIQLDGTLTVASRVELFYTSNMGHVSVRGGRCLLSNRTHLSLVDLNGNGVTPLIEHGMVGDGYDRQVKASWDPTGQVVCFRSNRGTDRDDLFLLEVPR